MSDNTENYHFETLQLHAGQEPAPGTNARAVPIYQTTSYTFDDTAHGARLFALAEFGDIYTRISNPTTDVFERRVAALEGGIAALATSSGQAAQLLALTTLCEAGDRIAATSSLYGGTYNQLKITLPRLGIHVDFVEGDDPESFFPVITDATKAIYVETLGNPRFNIPDLAALAEWPTVTTSPSWSTAPSATPCLCRPIEHGADIVIHSATKFIGGHGTSIGGVIVDSGRLPLEQTADSPGSRSRARAITAFDLGRVCGWENQEVNSAFIVMARVELLRDLGPTPSPFNSFLLLQGLETLSLRVERQAANALELAHWLEKLTQRSPGCPAPVSRATHGTTAHAVTCATEFVAFSPSASAAARMRAVVHRLAPTGLASGQRQRFQVIGHPPRSTTHQQLTDDEQLASGVTPDLIRVSVGSSTSTISRPTSNRHSAGSRRPPHELELLPRLGACHELGAFELEDGAILPDVRIASRSWGRLAATGPTRWSATR